MSKVVQLPVQNPTRPRCPECGAPISTLSILKLDVRPDEIAGLEVLGVTLHVRCACGKSLDLEKRIR